MLTVYCSQEAFVVVVVVDRHKKKTWWRRFDRTVPVFLRSIQRMQEDQHSLIETRQVFLLLYEVQQQQLLVIPQQHVSLNQYVA